MLSRFKPLTHLIQPFQPTNVSTVIPNNKLTSTQSNPNIVSPTTHINCNFPTIPNLNPATHNTLGSLIDNIGPTGIFMLAGLVWILKKFK